ncbi:GNAT family N-acetyltransferase [Thiomicrorhabdus heinhorstiae]|uniref:N-acetyltransferase n=1 Tax=Thiomicrorhabdus heinhorstiae TaxID=2748010 RepID=A0ABS0BUI7_9GAMM|nr:GNAT family N-acetyltransferase [Thiomicrorhabdus heinhorstiae]MBF6056765.1 N-acetyltransferase [Thiomicrorhabdus heinhorstiae]
MPELHLKILSNINEISAEDWNRLHGSDNPFIQHAFLHALEDNDCVGAHYGWLPKHLILYEDTRPVAAMPLYEKHNNYGEFVFDHAWSQAWQQFHTPYYPKLVSAIPYTPATGPRLLVDASLAQQQRLQLRDQLWQSAKDFCVQHDYSGLHLLFAEEQHGAAPLKSSLQRCDIQYQWFNQNYAAFDDFLAQLAPKKRKNIQRERRAIAQSGIHIKRLNGHQATAEDWQAFDHFYQKTFIDKWSTPTLNLGFFQQLGQSLPDSVLLVLAYEDDRCIAGALMLHSKETLYGRHWGCIEERKFLHFETCFYQGIEYAIEQGIRRFEPGAGGEHKIARGFIPVKTLSAHELAPHPLESAVARFCNQEAELIERDLEYLWQHSPYKDNQALRTMTKDSYSIHSYTEHS